MKSEGTLVSRGGNPIESYHEFHALNDRTMGSKGHRRLSEINAARTDTTVICRHVFFP